MKRLMASQMKCFLLLFLMSPWVDVLAQYVPINERGNPNARRRSTIDTNTVRTSLHNFGFGGRTGGGQGFVYEWPKGTDRYYLALATMFVGGEVVDVNGDTIHIVSVPAFRNNPANGQSWNFEPVPQYQNSSSNQLARSDDPSTWPALWIDKLGDSTDPGWPGSWNGLLGKNAFINGSELYHHYADNMDSRYRFYSIPSDTTRRGLGIVVSHRTLAWREPFLEDAIITVSDIYNVGAQAIQKAGVTMWIADFLGGDGDSQDDWFSYNLARRTYYFKDRDGVSINIAFQNARVLIPALTFLQTPRFANVEIGMTNIQYLPAGVINFSQTPDSFFWNTFLTPGRYTNPHSIVTGEYDAFVSCSYFTLPAQSSERFVTAFVFAEDSVSVNRKVDYLRGLVGGGYSPNGVPVSITSPQSGQVLSGQVPIHWNAGAGRQSLKLDIFYSSNTGDGWRLLAQGEANDGTSLWNTDTLSDGIFYKLLLVAYDTLGLGYKIMDSTCTINNPQQAPPQIRLNKSIIGQVWQSQITVRWVAGDADGDSVTVDLAYRIQGTPQWISLLTGLPNTGQHLLDVSSLPNSRLYILKAIARAGTMNGTDTVGLFEIRNPRYVLAETAFVQRNTRGTGVIQPRIVNQAQVNGHTYNVIFSGSPDSATSYDVIDQNSGLTVVTGATQINGSVEGPSFDGMRMFIRTDPVELDRIRWNRPVIHGPRFNLYSSGFDLGFREPKDYRVVVGNVGIDTSNAAFIFESHFPSRIVNVTVRDGATGDRIPFAFVEIDGNDGRFTSSVSSYSDFVVLLRGLNSDSLRPTWMVWMTPDSLANPAFGDTLAVNLLKPFQNLDSYRFTAVTGPLLSVPVELPARYILHQNYPNPFNPQTEIRFSIGSTQHTMLEIYDILGRKVRTLVNEHLDPGAHLVRWDGRNESGLGVASGVYFYRINAGSFVQTRKMLLLR